MTRYVVLEPGPGRSADAVILRDRFHALAFFAPPVWFAAHGAWIASGGALLTIAALLGVSRLDGFGTAAFVLLALFGLLVALEGPRLVHWRLRHRGFREAAVVHAADLEEAELLYLATADDPEPAPAAASPAPSPSAFGEPARGTLPLFGWRSGRTLLDAGRRP